MGCGCDDEHACAVQTPEGLTVACSWVAVDAEAGIGICSACAEKPIAELAETSAWLGLELAADGDRILGVGH